jgi:hypothetical protein
MRRKNVLRYVRAWRRGYATDRFRLGAYAQIARKDLRQIICKVTLRVWTNSFKAEFHSSTEAVDTTTPAGLMMMQMVVAFAA